ncbi:predicted GPI-anchored protein 58 [Phragmites australis]|uniref:predicted GPI-anchored protein 58 n=1 Tax=Phragmites australis TaxID=29695 RepID=UPI002D770080|nr:predicted GPI-anchored protein 58 [Phragmites australis]
MARRTEPPAEEEKADPGRKSQGPDFKIPESRWPPKDPVGDQRRPEAPRPAPAPEPSVPALEPSAPPELEPQALPCLEPRAVATPEQPAPAEPAPSSPRAEQAAAVEVVAARVATPAWRSSGTPSASAKRAHRGPSARPSYLEPLPNVLGSAWEVIERLEAVVAAKRAELGRDRAALIEQRGH